MSWIRRETEKGTVLYICPNCRDYHEFQEDFGEHTFSENFIFCRRCGAKNGTGTPPTLTPQNEWVRVEELREMDGEPVYVASAIGEHSAWYIVDLEENELKNPWDRISLENWDEGYPYTAYLRLLEEEKL